MPNGVRSSAPHAVAGLCFMLLGGTLVLDRLGMLEAGEVLRFWPVGLILLGGGMMVQALRPSVDASGRRHADFPVGALIWLVLLGVLFTHTFERRGSAARADGDGGLTLLGLLGGDTRTPTDVFTGGSMTSVLGGTQLDLRQTHLAPGQSAVVDVLALMGGSVIYVPKEWRVDVQTTAIMGGVKDERRTPPARGGRRGARMTEGPSGGPPARVPERETETETETGTETGAASVTKTAADAPATTPAETAPPAIEREDDPVTILPADAPRLVVRGFVMMGGLVIKP